LGDARLSVITLAHSRIGSAVLLGAVGGAAPAGTAGAAVPGDPGAGAENAPVDARLYFASGLDAERVAAGPGTRILGLRSIGGGIVAEIARAPGPGAAPENATGATAPADAPPEAESSERTAARGTARSGLAISIGGATAELQPAPPEPHLFAGQNVALAQRNGESAEAVAAWLAYHARWHGLTAALVLDRAAPGSDAGFLEGLARSLAPLDGIARVVVVRVDHPLGKPDLPAEAHPFCAPDAPGKDRMERPPPDPWAAPIGEVQLVEYLRHRFLSQARAVAALDVCDLLEPLAEGAPDIFTRAARAPGGLVELAGRLAYPWRLRPDTPPLHGDHICVKFDATRLRRRWCVAPEVAGAETVWRQIRVVGAEARPADRARFFRCMALRHPTDSVARIAPKTALVEDPGLIALATGPLGHKPVRMPAIDIPRPDPTRTDTAIVTCMKNEGPFILDWLAWHRAIGVQTVLVYTNDCTDGTDGFLRLLEKKGLVQHRENPFRQMNLKPQHAALQAAETEPAIRDAAWVVSMDVDEYINIKVGDGTLAALYEAAGDANLISMTWRLFGNADVDAFEDRPVFESFTRCAPEMTRKPHQAWGFKTLYRNIGLFKKLGVHRPKGLNPQLWNEIRWIGGSGKPLPREMFRNAWRSTTETVGYDMVQLNHYAVRSAESFLVKRDRGRVNHVDRDQGLAYWFRMNNNAEEETSILSRRAAFEAERRRLAADPEIAAAHAACVSAHRQRIAELMAREDYARFHAALTSERMMRLSRMHHHFGANVFLAGPKAVPDDVVFAEHSRDFFFTVERSATMH
jgi:hypothetical protein